MSIELLQTLSFVSYIIAAVLLVLGIALFFLLDVPHVIGDVSGTTAKKAIDNIRKQNELTGNKAYKPSPVNAERGKVTDKITPSGKLIKQESSIKVSTGTEKINTARLTQQSNETTILDSPTVKAVDYKTDTGGMLGFTSNEQTDGQTTILCNSDYQAEIKATNSNTERPLTVELEMEFLGSTEIIE